MSYVVLARKYRPRSFDQMVGQAHVVQALTNALQQQRLHHAYLFTGTRGVGKTTVSRILAKSLNCTGPDGTGGITAHPCGVCTACTEIDADRYIDYVELDAASNRSIDEIRDLIERAAYKPSVGRFKVFMIDEAHQLTRDAFNALLKTLEEPPEYLKFVLATTDPDKMLPTVLSRCLQFNLRPMAPETVHEHLLNVLQAEGVPFDAPSLRLLSRAARGSMRDALSLTDQAIAYGGGALADDTVRAMLGSVDRGDAASLVRALAQRDGTSVLAGVQALRERGLSAAATLEEMATLLQQVAVAQMVPGALDETDPDTGGAVELAALMPPDETQLLYSIALHGRAELSLAPDEYAGLTMVLLRLLAFPSAGGAPQGVGRPQPVRTAAAAVPVAAPAAQPMAPAAALRPSPSQSVAPLAVAGAAATIRTPVPPPVRPERTAVPPPTRAESAAAPAAPARPLSAPARPPASAAAEVAPSRPAPAPAARPPAPAAARSPSAALQEPPSWHDEVPPWDDEPGGWQPGAAPETEPADFPLADEPALAVPAASPARPQAAVEAAPELAPTVLGERWTGVVQQLRLVALVRELAMQAELVAVEEADAPLWRLRVERESLRNPALCEKLQTALREVVHPALRLEVEAGKAQDSPALREAAERDRRQRQAERIIQDDPLVQQMLQRYPTARIVPGSIKPN
ncbi:DNA polymerase III subunit gamma/tau [Azohydromonas caseinilytica]|uniref:DNA polymerase III subunit gamma/tau n=1 Tax=Azohydromonas caseinilytica TaxID=2728836 RepID=A0A848FAB3_9BURK|nr:DNA polymerase III subunit gamma/tau [Azohydromonas caseinilytica]NML15389.1 DNA polymerase III subunit gamma/tau [Azohydromonas caseinilytica]